MTVREQEGQGQWRGQTLVLTKQVRGWDREVTASTVMKEKYWHSTTEVCIHLRVQFFCKLSSLLTLN